MTSFADPEQPYGTGTVLRQQQAPASSMGTMTAIGLSAQLTGAFIGAIGAWASADAQKTQLKSQAMSAEFAAAMSALNARRAEQDAQELLAAGRGEIGRLTMAGGQRLASLRVSAARRGVDGSSGSAAEVQASERIVTTIDAMTIDRNTVRAANQARAQAVNAQNQSLLAGVSGSNIRSTANSIRPAAAFGSSSLISGGQIAANYSRRV